MDNETEISFYKAGVDHKFGMLCQATRSTFNFSSFRAEAGSAIAASVMKSSSNKISLSMERTGQWVLSQDIPTDIVVEVGVANFALHKFMLVAKSNYIRKLVMESKEKDLTKISLSEIPGGADIFEKAAMFIYGMNFEITVHNVAALQCAAEYLQMTDEYSNNNLIDRTNDFLTHVALRSLSGTVAVLKSCEDLLPMAEDLKIVEKCVEVASLKASKEGNFPTRSPPNWWTEELTILDVKFFGRIIRAMKQRGATATTLASAIMTYAEKSLKDQPGKSLIPTNTEDISRKRELLESIVSLFPSEKTAFPTNFLCDLLRVALFVKASNTCRKELEKRISILLEQVTVDDLLVLSFSPDGGQLFDLESVRRIVSVYVEKEKSVAVFSASDFKEVYSTALQKVAKTVDVYLGEIAVYNELSISKFNGIANLVPKGARKIEDDLYRAVDIYLKAHPDLEEIEREKVCSVMDPLNLSYEARLHASQNKRLPVQIVLQALYHDQMKTRSGTDDQSQHDTTRSQVLADISLVKENENLRTELMMMKMHLSNLQQKNQEATSSKGLTKRPTFLSSMSKKFGKLNPFRLGSRDTSSIVDESEEIKKPRRRRFSIS